MKNEFKILKQLDDMKVSCVPTFRFSGKVIIWYCLVMDVTNGKVIKFKDMTEEQAAGCIAALNELHEHHSLLRHSRAELSRLH
jgi:hypothetical protein